MPFIHIGGLKENFEFHGKTIRLLKIYDKITLACLEKQEITQHYQI